MGDTEQGELGEEKEQASDGEEEERVAEVRDAVGGLSRSVVGRVVHGWEEDGFSVGEDVANGRDGGDGANGGGVLLASVLQVIGELG
jgi:hypothetical protein